MEVKYLDLNSSLITDNLVICVGNFDGFHKGHFELFKTAKKYQESNPNTKIALLSFDQNPANVISNNKNASIVTSLELKLAQVEYIFDYYLILKFSEELANTSADGFIAYLKRLGMEVLICGSDYRFGHNASGNIGYLQKRTDLKLIVVDPLLDANKKKISSSDIHQLLVNGDIKTINKLLYYPYSLAGIVIANKQNGRKINFPTANIKINNNQHLLPVGVYIGNAYLNNRYIGSCLINIGFNPTTGSNNDLTIEAHILDFKGDLYGKTLRIDFLDFIRKDQKFANLEQLRLQLEKDVQVLKSKTDLSDSITQYSKNF
jgi:riboflavin kinase/FMN adenylyltransferase